MIVDVLLPLGLDQPFTYGIPEGMTVREGDFVVVPFGGKKSEGVVWSLKEDALSPLPLTSLKSILSVLSPYQLPPLSKSFIVWVSRYTLAPLGMVLKMVMSAREALYPLSKRERHFPLPQTDFATLSFSHEQRHAIDQIKAFLQEDSFSVTLLDGVTGSGKTEVYMEGVSEALSKGNQILIMLPEIALSPQTLGRFKGRFGVEPLLWHSDLTKAYRRDVWKTVIEGHPHVVIGARSALFLPYQQLGLIVVDEEHETAYKQEEGVLYQARDMAVVRASLQKIPLILVSATPSLETSLNAQNGKYGVLPLKERFKESAFPDIQLVDMREKEKGIEKHWISRVLVNDILETVNRGEQALLFLNRRGYAPLVLCKACGEKVLCKHCSSSLVLHRSREKLLCHQCGFEKDWPKTCEPCSAEDSFTMCGPGVERVYEEMIKRFPKIRSVMISSDLISSPKKFQELLDKIHNKEVDVVVGTQMMAKGHHFPLLTLVGVIDADMGLMGGDLRACEKTFQLLYQVAGRTGREERQGKVLIQTYQPEHPVMQALLNHDRDAFMQEELLMREMCHMPPYTRLAGIVLSGKDEISLLKWARGLVRAQPLHSDVDVLGPVAAPLYRIKNDYRVRLLIRSPKAFPLQEYVRTWLKSFKIPSAIKVRVDMDPYSFL